MKRKIQDVALQALKIAAASALKTRIYKDAGEWARINRILPNESSIPGPYNPDRTPYLLPIYEAVENVRYKEIVMAIGSQMAKTEFCLNVIGFHLDTRPTQTMFVLPTQAMAEAISKDRFSKMLRLTTSLWNKLAKHKQLNQICEKWISGVRMSFTWASSAAQLCSYPCGLVVFDERDRMVDDVEGNGDPVEQGRARTVSFPNAKVIVVSSPTIAGASAIWKLYESGTQGSWHLPCPHCNVFFAPKRTLMQWQETDGLISSAWLNCPNCKGQIDDKLRENILPRGKYIFKNPNADKASFWVSGICSPWQTILGLAKKLHPAEVSKNRSEIKAILNTAFGECYEDKAESFSVEMFKAVKRNYLTGSVPPEVEVISCGCDVQKDEIYYVVRGWGKKDQSWFIDCGVILGETDKIETWQALAQYLKMPIKTPKGNTLPSLICIDAGYRLSTVTEFCRMFGQNALACKGRVQRTAPITMSKTDPYSGKKLALIDDGYFKTMMFSKIKNMTWYVPSDVSDEFLVQMTAEVFVIPPDGKPPKWQERITDRNHYLDAEKLNMVAATLLRVNTLNENKPSKERTVTKGFDVWQ